MTLTTPSYQRTRQAWRDIWTRTDFDRELRSLTYPHFAALLASYLPHLPPGLPVLEAGCGPGHVVYYLRDRGYAALGADYAPEALKATHDQFPDLPLHVADIHH